MFIREESHHLAWNVHPSPRLLKLGELNPILSLICNSLSGPDNHNNVISGKTLINKTIIFTNVIIALPSILEKVSDISNLHLVLEIGIL